MRESEENRSILYIYPLRTALITPYKDRLVPRTMKGERPGDYLFYY